ncbi:lysine N(6)-hydroxylase/L-ornithine N(5)-oxygenase family protein [Chitinophaga solisilvae]|uniref:lysine N(6)-hydroxylase/L-ornithine N(5)-oxygenase family protein n=1 Tax=Chitinophaga solisilvae TaxID=1233460 RepID=UPI001368660B|nr:SidA/IucD/PvdA family monooxygenase [Chitinophaga solisilvae]
MESYLAPRIYDLAGIGIGPFNLGLAALAQPVASLSCIFLDSKPCFSWHPGLMMDFTTVQVPFYADLVTLTNPASSFSFLCYLKAMGRIIRFAIRENNYISRREYNDYCCWVAAQLGNLRFGHEVTDVTWNTQLACYTIHTLRHRDHRRLLLYARKLVLGTGSVPSIPDFLPAAENTSRYFHSGRYLFEKEGLLQKPDVTLIGSGQSAAEIFYDLLQYPGRFPRGLHWFTRSGRIHPMDTGAFSFELTSPAYIRYFYHLPEEQKKKILPEQALLYKGINRELLHAIYETLYQRSVAGVWQPAVRTACSLENMELQQDACRLYFHQTEQQQYFHHDTAACILATGYAYTLPAFLQPVRERIMTDEQARYIVGENYAVSRPAGEVFVQNAELHTHGFSAPDLGLGPHRNAVIINNVLGYTYYKTEDNPVFQHFGKPE